MSPENQPSLEELADKAAKHSLPEQLVESRESYAQLDERVLVCVTATASLLAKLDQLLEEEPRFDSE
jgi:hypothetical protein